MYFADKWFLVALKLPDYVKERTVLGSSQDVWKQYTNCMRQTQVINITDLNNFKNDDVNFKCKMPKEIGS